MTPAPDVDAVLSGRVDPSDESVAERLAEHPLESIETEYPHHAGSVADPDDPPRPSETHPVFYGCYDWHSAVHSHWALVRQLRLFDDHPRREEIVASVDARLTPENVAAEVAYLDEHESFEKPYGWAWLLHLAAELSLWDDDPGEEWRSTLAPLEERVVSLVESEFLTADRPFRVGTHGNTAFALHCVLDYARTTDRPDLESAVVDVAVDFYGDDRDYPVEYEPLGWDFLSPALTEADLVRRVYDEAAFRTWLDGFLPDVTSPPHDDVLEPVSVDADEGVALHLVGLNVSKAWCLAGLADALPDHDLAPVFERSARRHAERGVAGAFTDDYAGAHWLSSFVCYLLTRDQGAIAPE